MNKISMDDIYNVMKKYNPEIFVRVSKPLTTGFEECTYPQRIPTLHERSNDRFKAHYQKKPMPFIKPSNAVFPPPDPNVLYYGECYDLTREGE